MKRGIIFSLLFIILLDSVFALVIQPPKLEINYNPKQEYSCGFSILNNENTLKTYSLTTKGILNESITLEKEIKLEPDVWKTIPCKINSNLNLPPGTHESSIVILESKEGQAVVGAVGGIELIIYAYVPYPGKYIEGELLINDAHIDENIPIKIKVINRGKEPITNLESSISIQNNQEEVANLKTQSTSLALGEEKILETSWQTSTPGTYKATALVYFDQNHKPIEKEFRVGAPRIDILDVLSNKIKKDTIARVEVLLKNQWNDKIEDVYSRLFIKKDDKFIEVSQSPSAVFQAWEEKTTELFFDTTGYEPKIYAGKIIVYYEDKTSEKDIVLEVEEKGFNILTVILILVIIFLIVLLLINFKKRKNKNEKK
ncbi:MAG: hypothetical protein PHG05_00870 [Candidatus Nanoarchaeia archaeon]|nr:hypothetical protein [Candidatus Nanoarchaeia archaeon]